MKVLIAGGAGYIGSHAVKVLLECGYDVVVVDNLTTGHKEAVDKRSKLYVGDIRDQKFLSEVFETEKIDAVMHFCAKSLVGVSMNEPLDYFDNNVSGTISLLEVMNKYDVKKIVFSSSAAVYGEHEVMPITEEYATVPTNPYGQTKLQMEQIMKWVDLAYGMKYVSLRYFNVGGAYTNGEIGEDHSPETHLIPLIIQTALGLRDHLNVYGSDYATKDGTCIRDYVHIIDLIDAHVLALEYLNEGNESNIFNLGSQDGYSVLEMIESAEDVIGHKINYRIVGRRAGDPATLIATADKAKRILGWKPKYGISDMIASAYKFHSNHPKGY